MESKQLLLGILTVLFVFGAYFIGLFQGQRNPIRWREFFRSLVRSTTRQGFAWSVTMPVLWIALYYGLIVHIWLSLGRWPRFNERLEGRFLSFHEDASRYLFAALVCSLYVVPVVFLVCLFLRRWRHVSVYALCYSAAVGIATGALFLAPHAFLNWLFD